MKTVKTLSKKERHAQGKALREKCARTAHSEWKPRTRSQDPIKLIEESSADRIPGLVPLRYERMSESPFTFFRGTAIIQARDLANSPVSGITVQACGDCHLMNFGGFATPERTLVFDINDFDETFPGPWEWDVKRWGPAWCWRRGIGVSPSRPLRMPFELLLSRIGSRCLTSPNRLNSRDGMHRSKSEDLLEFFRKDQDFVSRLRKKHKSARSATSEAVFPKLTAVVNGHRKIKDNPPVLYHFQENVRDFEKTQQSFWEEYKKSLQGDRQRLFERYQWQDGTIKVVGVGSVGTRCYVVLYLADEEDSLFLQVKEARRSVLELPRGKSRFAHQGLRIVEGQRLMQAASDIFLGWAHTPHHDYYVRQFRDMKVSAEPETFKPRTLTAYATMCGWALARAHAKAGDAAMIAGYLGSKDSFDKALVDYSEAYADQAERDFEAFKLAIRSGRLRTKPDKASGLEFLV